MDAENNIRDDAQNEVSDQEDVMNIMVQAFALAVREEDLATLKELASQQHSADLADILQILPANLRRKAIELLRADFDPSVLAELDGEAFEDAIFVLEPEEIADAVSQMDTDDAVFVLEEMDEADKQEILSNVAPDDRIHIEEGLAYPEDSAGRLMQRDMISVPPFWTIGQTLDFMRDHEDLPNDFWEIFVVDPHHRPIGTVPLSWVLRSKRPTLVRDIMKEEQTLFPVDMDQEEVARQFRQYNLVSAAVVDSNERLVGMITVDDVVDVIEEEAGEDILALGGVSDGDINISITDIMQKRLGWLVINLITAILASVVIGVFGGSIEQMVALAVLMPIVASMGGNAGTQTMTVAVRALATHELTVSNAWRIVHKELWVGIGNGAILALLTGVVAAFWFDSAPLGAVIFAAMMINLIVAGLAGILIPIALDRMDVDPAVSSGVFVTTVTDVVGFFAFLSLASLVLL